MDRPITTRLPEEFVRRIKELAEKENLDFSAIIRRLLSKALEEEKLKLIIEKLNQHKISIGQAAEELNVSLWDMIIITKKHNIDWIDLTENELEEQLKILNSLK